MDAQSEQQQPQQTPADDFPSPGTLVTVIHLAGGDTIETLTDRETVLGALSNVLTLGERFFYVDPVDHIAQSSNEQTVVLAAPVVALSTRPFWR